MYGGAAGLLFAAFVLTLWMLPRLLDASVLDARYEVAKFVLLPAAGLAIASAWGRCPPLGRLFVHIEGIATLLRFGWGYVEAPDRLCAVYLLDEQQDVGIALLILGCVLCAGGQLAGVVRWAVVIDDIDDHHHGPIRIARGARRGR